MPAWITIAGGSRTGPAQLSYTVAANTGTVRSVTLTVAGRPIVVNQAAASPPSVPQNLRIVGE